MSGFWIGGQEIGKMREKTRGCQKVEKLQDVMYGWSQIVNAGCFLKKIILPWGMLYKI